MNNKTFVIESVYARVIDEPKFFDFLFSAITDFTDNDLVIGRNWNSILNNQLDKFVDPHIQIET